MDIADKVFIVTGGASGLGEGTARMLAAHGGLVVIADLQADKGEALASELCGAFVTCDVCQEIDGQAVIAKAVSLGKLMGLVNCAGIAPAMKTVGKSGAHDLHLFAKVVTVNLIGSFNMIRLAAEAMARNEPESTGERGVMISTASVAAFDGQIGQAAYAASKGGIVGMTLAVARDMARSGIRNMTIAPGIFGTPMAVLDATGSAGIAGRRCAFSESPGDAGRLREAGAPDRHERDAEWRGDPPRRCDSARAKVDQRAGTGRSSIASHSALVAGLAHAADAVK